MQSRTCKRCNQTLPATGEFFVTLKRANGWRGFAAECRPCRNLRYRPFYEKNRQKLIARAVLSNRKVRATPEGAEKNRVASREAKRRMLADPIKRAEHAQRSRDWVAANPEKAKAFKHNHPSAKRARAARRRANLRQATPPWADHRIINAIYAIADYLTKRTGVLYEVDHYYPLAGKICSGLHVQGNLRVIPAGLNRAKGNRMPEQAR